MPISKDSTKFIGFNTCSGTIKFLRLHISLKTSPNSFKLLMDKVLHVLTFKSVLYYLDDVLICSKTVFGWTNAQENTFKELKRLLQNSFILSFPRYD